MLRVDGLHGLQLPIQGTTVGARRCAVDAAVAVVDAQVRVSNPYSMLRVDGLGGLQLPIQDATASARCRRISWHCTVAAFRSHCASARVFRAAPRQLASALADATSKASSVDVVAPQPPQVPPEGGLPVPDRGSAREGVFTVDSSHRRLHPIRCVAVADAQGRGSNWYSLLRVDGLRGLQLPIQDAMASDRRAVMVARGVVDAQGRGPNLYSTLRMRVDGLHGLQLPIQASAASARRAAKVALGVVDAQGRGSTTYSMLRMDGQGLQFPIQATASARHLDVALTVCQSSDAAHILCVAILAQVHPGSCSAGRSACTQTRTAASARRPAR
jgi:hypothetical protein